MVWVVTDVTSNRSVYPPESSTRNFGLYQQWGRRHFSVVVICRSEGQQKPPQPLTCRGAWQSSSLPACLGDRSTDQQEPVCWLPPPHALPTSVRPSTPSLCDTDVSEGGS